MGSNPIADIRSSVLYTRLALGVSYMCMVASESLIFGNDT